MPRMRYRLVRHCRLIMANRHIVGLLGYGTIGIVCHIVGLLWHNRHSMLIMAQQAQYTTVGTVAL